MFSQLKFKTKIPLVTVGFALAVNITLCISNYYMASKQVSTATHQRMTAIAQDRKLKLEGYLESIEIDLKVIASNPITSNAIRDFKHAWSTLGNNPSDTLKKIYIHNNPNEIGKKHLLDKGATGSSYDETHGKYHPWFREFLNERGYYDIFLFDLEGNLIYTVFKEEDFSTNFKNNAGQWSATDLGTAYREAVKSVKGTSFFFDFKAYAPSNNVPASFISTPVFENGKVVGVLAFQMPIDKINHIMNASIGLGETGEALIVGQDFLLRNDSRFSKENDILITKIQNPYLIEALQGQQNLNEVTGYRNTQLAQYAQPFNFLGTKWAIVVVQSTEELNAPLLDLRNSMVMISLIMFCISAGGGYLIGISMSGPISNLVSAMKKIASGIYDIPLKDTKRADEIGDMCRAVEIFKANAIERNVLEKTAEEEHEKEHKRQNHLEKTINQFKTEISDVLDLLNAEIDVMKNSANTLNSVAGVTSKEAKTAKQASIDATSNVQAVAATADQLLVSIKEIATQSTKTSDFVADATQVAESTDRDVKELSEAAEKIGNVVEMIRAIAAQTNLLALNATIEAARAGDAGKGFAVVAQEVKQLSNQTAKATDEIAIQIGSVQTLTKNSVHSIGTISASIYEIDQLTTSIASAVEEQNQAMQEISRNISLAANGSTQASESVNSVFHAIEETNQEASCMLKVSDKLTHAAIDLAKAVESVLQAVSNDMLERRGSLRRLVNESVKIEVEGLVFDSQLIDVSEGGLRMTHVPNLKKGMMLKVYYNNGRVREAKCMWVKANEAGIRFETQSANSLLAA